MIAPPTFEEQEKLLRLRNTIRDFHSIAFDARPLLRPSERHTLDLLRDPLEILAHELDDLLK